MNEIINLIVATVKEVAAAVKRNKVNIWLAISVLPKVKQVIDLLKSDGIYFNSDIVLDYLNKQKLDNSTFNAAYHLFNFILIVTRKNGDSTQENNKIA